MKWYRKLYLGAGIKKNKEELIKKIETNAGLPDTYLVTLAANGRDLFDIFSTNLLFQPVLHGHCPLIIGVCKGHQEAVEMAAEIALAAYRENRDFDICKYLQGQLEDGEEMICEYPMEKLKKRTRFRFRK